MYNTYCFFTTKLFARTFLSVTLCKKVHLLPCVTTHSWYSYLLQVGSDTNSVLQNIPPYFHNCSSSNDNYAFTGLKYLLSLPQKPGWNLCRARLIQRDPLQLVYLGLILLLLYHLLLYFTNSFFIHILVTRFLLRLPLLLILLSI